MSLMEKVTSLKRKTAFKLGRHGDDILTYGGIALTIFGTIWNCRAAVKMDRKAGEHEECIEKAKNEGTYVKKKYKVLKKVVDGKLVKTKEEIVTVETKHPVRKAYGHVIWDYTKSFGPGIVAEIVGLGSITGAHIHEKRVYGKLAAYTAGVVTQFANYRKEVAAQYGDEAEKAIFTGKTVKNEDGTTSTELNKDKFDPNKDESHGNFSRFFDCASREFVKDNIALNISFLKNCEQQLNRQLQRDGYLFINDVYRMLDIPECRDGHDYGWVYKPGKNPYGENIVDFGVFKPENHRFVNGYEEDCLLLDFNIDKVPIRSIIWPDGHDKMPAKDECTNGSCGFERKFY